LFGQKFDLVAMTNEGVHRELLLIRATTTKTKRVLTAHNKVLKQRKGILMHLFLWVSEFSSLIIGLTWFFLFLHFF